MGFRLNAPQRSRGKGFVSVEVALWELREAFRGQGLVAGHQVSMCMCAALAEGPSHGPPVLDLNLKL